MRLEAGQISSRSETDSGTWTGLRTLRGGRGAGRGASGRADCALPLSRRIKIDCCANPHLNFVQGGPGKGADPLSELGTVQSRYLVTDRYAVLLQPTGPLG